MSGVARSVDKHRLRSYANVGAQCKYTAICLDKLFTIYTTPSDFIMLDFGSLLKCVYLEIGVDKFY